MNRAPKFPIVVAAVLSISLVASCGIIFNRAPPDPAKIQEVIAEYRNQELELVRETIQDPEKADRFIELLGQRDRLVAGFAEDIVEYRSQMAELNADYSAERGSFDSLVDGFNKRREAGQLEIAELIGAMRAETTPEEWKVIASFQTKRLDPRRLTYGQAATGD